MTTHYLSTKEAQAGKKWHLVDAQGQTLGRLATKVATLLRGKHKPSFTPNQDCGDFVIVVNAGKVKVTGNKLKAKKYHHYTGFIGGLKTASLSDLIQTDPDRVIRYAVEGMLPGGKLGRQICGNLKIYADDVHPHHAQKPEIFENIHAK